MASLKQLYFLSFACNKSNCYGAKTIITIEWGSRIPPLWLPAALSGFQLITFWLHLVINNVAAGGGCGGGGGHMDRMTRSWPRASCLSKKGAKSVRKTKQTEVSLYVCVLDAIQLIRYSSAAVSPSLSVCLSSSSSGCHRELCALTLSISVCGFYF